MTSWFYILVFVLYISINTERVVSQQVPPGSAGFSYISNITTTSKRIRFEKDGFIRYNMRHFAQSHPQLIEPTNSENFSMQFITRESSGLVWLDERPDFVMYLAVKDGYLVFVVDDRLGQPQEVVLRNIRVTDINDWNWHTVSIVRTGRKLDFYIDDIFVTSMTLRRDIQFITGNMVYLGGAPEVSTITRGAITVGYTGALTEVIYYKTPTRYRVIKISLLTQIGTSSGGVIEITPGPPVTPRPRLTTTHAPVITTRRPTPRPIYRLIEMVSFTGANVHIDGFLDLRSGGNIFFQFKTLDSRGLIFFTHNRRGQQDNFLAMEIFDGKLYLVYQLGNTLKRQLISEYLVNDGNWHDIKIKLTQASIVVYIDEQPKSMRFSFDEQRNAYMGSGLYFAGVKRTVELPWTLWATKDSFIGCIRNFRLENINNNLRALTRLPTGVQGLQFGCTSFVKRCDQSPCLQGTCAYTPSVNKYYCYCAGTGYMGDRCERVAYVGGFSGKHYVAYYYPTTEITHTNDISFRFRTPLDNAFLFQTTADTHDQFIRGELENGRIKITIRTGPGNDEIETYYLESTTSLNDNQWHTFNLNRRAQEVEMWIDDQSHVMETIRDTGYYIHIDRIYFGTVDTDLGVSGLQQNYIGALQNVYFNNKDIFDELHNLDGINIIWIENIGDYPGILNYHPVTFTTRESYSTLEPLRIGLSMRVAFKFKTSEPNGVVFFNKGAGSKFLAMELVNGYMHFTYNNGYSTVSRKLEKKVDDGNWHMFQVRELRVGGARQYHVSIDESKQTVPIVGNDGLDLTGPLYIGGLPNTMFDSDNFIKNNLRSTHGFMGCLASVDLNGGTPELTKFSSNSQRVLTGCVDIGGVCPANNPCQNSGVCIPGVVSYTCNCDMTAYAGPMCGGYPLGMYFGKNGNAGSLRYTFKNLLESSGEDIAFGFMTYADQGILARFESQTGTEYIEIRLDNGYLVADYNTGNGVQTVLLDNTKYNDGNYHVVTFARSGKGSTFVVDGFAKSQTHSEIHSIFNRIQYVYVGGRQDSSGTIMNQYNGIIGGLYWNGYRFIDLAHATDIQMLQTGDLTPIGPSGYVLLPPVVVTPSVSVVTFPPPSPIPPYGGGPIVIPPEYGDGGVIGTGISGPGTGGGGYDIVGVGEAGSQAGGAGGFIPAIGTGVPRADPLSGFVGGGAPVTGAAGGVRAGALMGTILGTMAFMASLMWAFWKCKPGMIPLGGGGGGGGGGGPPAMAISSPAASTNLPVAQALGGHGAVSGSGSAAGGGGSATGAGGGAKVTILNGSATGGGGGGGSGSAFSAYYSASNASAAGGGGAGESYDSATLRATGTFSNKGTSIGTPKAERAFLGSGGAGGGGSSSYSYSATTTNVFGGSGGQSGGGGSSMDGLGYGESTTADYDMAPGISNYQSNALVQNSDTGFSSGGGTMGKGYSSSTMASSYNYQVQNVRTMMSSSSGHHMMSYGSSSSGAVTPGAAGDEVRVDCCLMTGDGRSVVTGSSLGPPQVWDMSTGELLRIMKGDTVGSTNLHLACNDRLLVGAVHADLEINDFSVRKGVTNKKLQIWDFTTGRPLEMGSVETCSALCVMSDPDKVICARSDKFGNATNFIVWDLLGNQLIKEMRYDAPIGNNDYINFLSLSQNDRYCVAGFTNTFDNFAEFVVFDVTLTSYNVSDPALLRLDANPDCTVILPRDEAVTGLRNGDLVVWNLRTGQPSRQLLSGSGGHAHNREIKAVALSKDNKYLVSASVDGTLKVWDMTTERQINTLTGHNDEVWCVAISHDSEIVVSGSRDGSIRLWRMKNGSEICAFVTGVDVFYVTMSHDKGTIVALGDKFGARKLIMLQVVRTKIRRQVSS